MPVLRRPLSTREKEEGEASVVTVSPATNEIALSTTLSTASLKRSKTYTFDKVRGRPGRKKNVIQRARVALLLNTSSSAALCI